MSLEHSNENIEHDSGFRRMVRWTLAALVGAVLFSAVVVYLVTRWFGGP